MPMRSRLWAPGVIVVAAIVGFSGLGGAASARGAPPELILHNAKIATMDPEFRIASALSVSSGRILQVGSAEEVLATRGPETRVVDLGQAFVIPGLIDSHTHPGSAALFEFDHSVPDMESIADVLDYIRGRTTQVPEGGWIWVNQVFITRLKERRYPTREELDGVAPKHPVVFSTGPDASVNTLALRESGIDRDFQATGSGVIERDAGGEPTGILRGGTKRYLKSKSTEKKASAEDRARRLRELFQDYNATGITAIADRNADGSSLDLYQALRAADQLTVRISASHALNGQAPLDEVRKQLDRIAEHPLRAQDPLLRIVGVKTFLDGGMLTGSAYMRQPWGVSDIYSIRDPAYRGVLFIPPEDLREVVAATAERGLQFTAHAVGDGAVYELVAVYQELSEKLPLRKTRPCITHCNFMGAEVIETMAQLGVVADIQPAWLYLDARTLQEQFGYERLRYFQPLNTLFQAGVVVGGGSDHMQKIGSLRSINPYNPFLGMWVVVTRQAKDYEGRLHAEEALSREQALRFYTTNNAYLLFREDEIGSLEPGKWADLVVLDRDLLTCPVDQIRETRVQQTYLQGKRIYPRTEQP